MCIYNAIFVTYQQKRTLQSIGFRVLPAARIKATASQNLELCTQWIYKPHRNLQPQFEVMGSGEVLGGGVRWAVEGIQDVNYH